VAGAAGFHLEPGRLCVLLTWHRQLCVVVRRDGDRGLLEDQVPPPTVVCLLSALRFHRLTTQAPFEVWLGIGVKARLPRVEYPPLRIVRFSGPAQTEGVEEHVIWGVTVRVTNPARTVVDCFKYRYKVGMDVALEALRDCRQKRKATVDELHRAAQARRMANVMRPYLEALA
jgi:predicted transcriptional regulator of viral defense system